MPEYRRNREQCTYFFTVVTADRRRLFDVHETREALRQAWRETVQRLPFACDAVVLLPDHLHCIWTLPDGDDDYPARWRGIKARFSRLLRVSGVPVETGRSASRLDRRERGYWQRRYWEHGIRDTDDFVQHADYIHYNPVKHGYVAAPKDWPWSSFHRLVREGVYEADWGRSEPDRVPAPERCGE